MMMSPELYSEEIKKYTKEELMKEKEKFEKYINDFNNNKLTNEQKNYKPSPETVVRIYKEYLNEIDKLTK